MLDPICRLSQSADWNPVCRLSFEKKQFADCDKKYLNLQTVLPVCRLRHTPLPNPLFPSADCLSLQIVRLNLQTAPSATHMICRLAQSADWDTRNLQTKRCNNNVQY